MPNSEKEKSEKQNKRIALPPPVAKIYQAIEELEGRYPGRKFTPDGHLVGSLGEVIAAEELDLELYPASHAGHDAHDGKGGDVQIKLVGLKAKSISLYATCARLVVLKIVSPQEAEIIYDGPGEAAWAVASKPRKNGQSIVRLSQLRKIAENSNLHEVVI